MRYLREVFAARELLANLTLREVRGKYKRTVFGQLWSLANPLALMLIYTFVFGLIFRIPVAPGNPSGVDVYALWLLSGLLPWTFFATVLNLGVGSLVSNAALIQKVYFARIVLPLALVGSSAYNWLFEMGVLVVALAIAGSFVLPWLPFLIIIMAIFALFAAGIALMLSVANVYFRDTQYFVTILLQMWMYLSPVIYPVTLVQDVSKDMGGLLGTPISLMDIYGLNPIVHFLEIFRNLIYDNRWPEPMEWIICTGWAIVMVVLGMIVFRKNEKNLAEAI